jgi:hypothetical protein
MPVKRTRSKQRDNRITPAAVEAYRDQDWIGLHRALGLKTWETSPLDAIGENSSPAGTGGAESWPKAVALREELEMAAGHFMSRNIHSIGE